MHSVLNFSDLWIGYEGYAALYFIALPIAASGLLAIIKPAAAPSPFGPRPRPKSIASAVLTVFRKTLMWRGRAGRSEFWWYMLFVITVQYPLIVVMTSPDQKLNPTLMWIGMAVFLPTGLAAGTRRLHDIGRSGWWQLLALTGTGYITLIILWLLPSQKEADAQVADLFE